MNSYHATPYDTSEAGFYFNNYEEYCKKANTNTNKYGDPIEEYEIQFIDGDNYELFNALNIAQVNLKQWFEEFENMETEDTVKAIYLANEMSYNIDEIHNKMDGLIVFEGDAEEYAEEYIQDTGVLDQMPESLRYYFDTQSFTRDLLINGDITETFIMGTDYVFCGG